MGSRVFSQSIADPWSPGFVGLALIVLAETGQIVATLALAIFGTSRFARTLLILSAIVFTCIALAGNGEEAKPWQSGGLFVWLEAYAPPILVLSMSYILKERFLEEIVRRHTDTMAYQEALVVWLERTRDPEQHPEWSNAYANALRDTIRKMASRSSLTRELVNTWDIDAWRERVTHEMRADSWYEAPQVLPVSSRLKPPGSQPYRYMGSMTEVDGSWSTVCPICGVAIGSGYTRKQSAHNGILSHIKSSHPEVS
jgi:hypothetical protein